MVCHRSRNTLPDPTSALEALNEKYTAVFANGSYRIMYREGEAETGTECLGWPPAKRILSTGMRIAASKREPRSGQIESYFAWRRVADMGGPQNGGWHRARSAFRTRRDHRWQIEFVVRLRNQGGARLLELFLKMIYEDLCSGDEAVFDYVLNWSAWKLQNPGLLPQVAIAFLGPKGAGKTTYGETMAQIFGCHGMVAEDIDQIAGRFNGHLESKCFVYADEAVWGGDKRNESALKKLITDKEGTYEYKGVDIFERSQPCWLGARGQRKLDRSRVYGRTSLLRVEGVGGALRAAGRTQSPQPLVLEPTPRRTEQRRPGGIPARYAEAGFGRMAPARRRAHHGGDGGAKASGPKGSWAVVVRNLARRRTVPFASDFEDDIGRSKRCRHHPPKLRPPIANGSTLRTHTPMCHRSGCLTNSRSGVGKAAGTNTGSPPRSVSAIGWCPGWTTRASYSRLGLAPTPLWTRDHRTDVGRRPISVLSETLGISGFRTDRTDRTFLFMFNG